MIGDYLRGWWRVFHPDAPLCDCLVILSRGAFGGLPQAAYLQRFTPMMMDATDQAQIVTAMNTQTEPMPSYIAIKVFGIVSAVLMTLIALLAAFSGMVWMSFGNSPEAWDMPNISEQAAKDAQMMGIAAFLYALTCLFAAFCGIGVALRWRWTRVGSIVAHGIQFLATLALLVDMFVQRAGDLHGRDERIAFVVMIGLLVFLFLYGIWALVTLLGPWAGKYFMRTPLQDSRT